MVSGQLSWIVSTITRHCLKLLVIGFTSANRLQNIWFTDSKRLSLKMRRASSGSSMSSFKICSHFLTRQWNTLKSAILDSNHKLLRFKFTKLTCSLKERFFFSSCLSKPKIKFYFLKGLLLNKVWSQHIVC